MEAHIGVAVTVLYADNQVTDDSHARTVTGELLVCGSRIILLCLYELVVEVNIIHSAFLQLPRRKQAVKEQRIQIVCRVEVVSLARVGCVGNVVLSQFLYRPEYGVCATGAKCRVKREMGHQMCGDNLYA